jgi:type I restriction enzyme, S subunit
MKKTDAGFIPEAWSAAKVTDTIKIAQGQVDPKKAPFDEMILVAPDHIESGTGRLTRKLTAKEQGAISGKYLFSSGDIIYSKIRPHLKKAIIADFDGLCSADMYPLTPRQGISAGYILALILGEKFSSYAESVSMRSGMPKINRTELSQYIWAVPPSGEQNAIALASSDIDALLAKLDQLIAKKRDIKQAAMQELLKGRRRLPGFDRKWEQHPLGKMLIERPTYGINAPAVPYSLSLPTYIRITDITDDGKFSSANPASVSHPSWPEYKLSEGDIVLARTGASTGKSYRYKESDGTLIYAGFLIRIRPDPAQLNPAFLECHLNSTEYWKWVQQTSMRSGQPGINGNEYARLSIPLPSIEEQTAIASILMEMGEEITALEARREKTRLIKQGMMQELLSGRVRLI